MTSADQLWSAALRFADRDSCAQLRPFVSARSALKQVAAQANGSPVGRLQLLDEAFFARAGDMSEALVTKRAQLVSAADDAAATVRRLGCLPDYEQRWSAVESAEQMRRRFMTVAEPLLVRLRAAITSAIAGIPGRRRVLSFRRQAVAADRARAMIVPVNDAAEVALRHARHAFHRAVRGYLTEVARQHRQFIDDRYALARQGVVMSGLRVSPPGIAEPDWRLPDLGEALRAAAGGSVRAMSAAAAHPLRYQARHVWLGRVYVVRAHDVRRAAQAALDEWLVTFEAALTTWLARVWELFVADYMADRDTFVQAWREHIAGVARGAEAELVRATTRIVELDDAADRLRELRRERDAWHSGDRAGLTPAMRAALGEIHRGLGGGGSNGGAESWLVDRLDALAGGGEADAFVPVVATMKAGKSTVLGAMLGLDIAPRRSHTMTAVATRYVITGAVSDPELRLGENVLADCERFSERIRARLTEDGAKLAGYPHLGRFARRMLREPAPLPGYCRGAEAVLGTLVFLNDLTRVAIVLLPAGELASIADWAPEVLVPAGQRTDSRVTLVDTPGLGEAMGKELLSLILDRTLRRADGCVLVLDYAQLDTIATTALTTLVAKRFGPRTGSAVWVAVNRIDQRRTTRDPNKADIRDTVGRLLALSRAPVSVVETRAELALAAAVCETSTDPDRYGPVLALIDPHGAMTDTRDPASLLRDTIRKSGLDALRRDVLGDLSRRAAALVIDGVIDQLPTENLDELRWALHSAGAAVAP